MQKIKIIAMGRLTEPYTKDAADMFLRRLSRFYQVTVTEPKPENLPSSPSEAEIRQALAKEAEKIIADAQAQADKILADAKAENDRIVKSGEDAIRQAGRNLLISFRESVARELNSIVGEHVKETYSSEDLEKLIVNVVESWANKPETEDITVILNSDDLRSVEDSLLAALKAKMLKGNLLLKANDSFDGGFRIAVNDSGLYYDYSAEAVVEMMSNYLSPKVKELLKEAE